MRRASWAIMDSGAWAMRVAGDTSGRVDELEIGGVTDKADDVICDEREGASVVVEMEEGERSWF